jgi:sortase B
LGAATLIGRKAIRFASGFVDAAILLAVLLLLAAGCYALWDSDRVYREANSANYAIYKPAEDGLSFGELRRLNADVFAWLTVYGTHIDYPVVQSEENIKYVNTNAKGDYSLSGAIFLDSAAKADFSDFASILYGHHMEKNAMFGEIGRFADKDFFDARTYGSLYFDGREHGLEFFAFLHADAYDGKVFRSGIRNRNESEAYLDLLLERAAQVREIGVTTEDRIILLSTCTASDATNGRDILVGRITDELYEDAFKIADDVGGPMQAVDGFVSLWSRLPFWVRPLLPALLLLAAAFGLRRAGARGRRTLGKTGKQSGFADAARDGSLLGKRGG